MRSQNQEHPATDQITSDFEIGDTGEDLSVSPVVQPATGVTRTDRGPGVYGNWLGAVASLSRDFAHAPEFVRRANSVVSW